MFRIALRVLRTFQWWGIDTVAIGNFGKFVAMMFQLRAWGSVTPPLSMKFCKRLIMQEI